MALGMIEVFGFATSIVVSDAMAKAADVKIVAIDKNKPAAGKCRKCGGSKPPPYGWSDPSNPRRVNADGGGDGYPVDYCERRLNFEQDSASGPAHV